MGAMFRSQAEAILTRYRDRRRHERKVLQQRTKRKPRSWVQCSQSNLMKMRYRHTHRFEAQTPNAWNTCISIQISKYSTRLDTLNAWQRREFFVLEKMNGELFKQDMKLLYGSAWRFACDMQSSKLARLDDRMRRPRSFRKWWSEVLHSAWFRLKVKRRVQPDLRADPWRMTVLANAKETKRLDDHTIWQQTIYNAWRRKEKLGDQSSA